MRLARNLPKSNDLAGQLSGHRVLVTGSTGWFGKTLTTLLGDKVNHLRISSTGANGTFSYDPTMIRDFEPTLVFNFAFLTEDKIPLYGPKKFKEVNRALISNAVDLCQIESVRGFVSISSGAVSHLERDLPNTSIYSELKKEEELALLQSAEGLSLVIPRVYSVSGPHVKYPSGYAFSSFVEAALDGKIKVEAANKTYRRYCSVEDVLRVCGSLVLNKESKIFETGGDLVELRDLAQIVRREVNPGSRIEFATPNGGESRYHSDNRDWLELCGSKGIHPSSLLRQIDSVAQYFRREKTHDDNR